MNHPLPLPVESDRQADREAIRALFARLVESWDRGDGAAYAACFTQDSEYVAFDGTRLVGREANARHHQQLFDGFLKGSRLVGQTVLGLRFLTPEVALVHASGTVQLCWQPRPLEARKSIQTLVALRQAGE